MDSYLRVRRASTFHPQQTAIADSILTRLAGDIDTLRVAQTVTALNATPERWAFIFKTIEDRLAGRDSTSASEPAGR